MTEENASHGRLIYQLQRAFVAVEARKAELLDGVGLLPAHYALLMNVRAHPGVIAARLARLLGVTPQNVTGLVARLIDRGLLERRPHERHTHVLELLLTDRGAQVLAEADALVGELERTAVTGLGEDAADRLRQLLEDLRRAVSEAPT